MTTLHNQITINAPIDSIWEALANTNHLEIYDPTVNGVNPTTESTYGIGAGRKVNMKDGKNWFEETCTVCDQNEALTFELTACSFPVHNLKHSYRFEQNGDQTKVIQTMEYQMKYGFFGKIMDAMMVKKQSNDGIRKFLDGLKSHVESSLPLR